MLIKQVSVKRVFLITSTLVVLSVILTAIIVRGNVGLSGNIKLFSQPDTSRIQNPVYQVPIPNSITFAGEQVPIHLFDIRESLDRELQVNTYWHSQTVLLLKRANRYFPVIEPILKEKGIPDDFKYLAVAESALTQVVSPSQAVGFWQILEGTGRELKLEINDEVDERYHIEKSTYAACDFLQKSYERYGSWTLAAASYNFGRNGINRQMERQKNDNYYDLVLGEETGRYLFRILAFKLIHENPNAYGFHLMANELYPPLKYYEVKVDSSITSFAQFATQFATNYKILKLYNPWLRESYLTNSERKSYTIKIPEIGFRESAYNED
jgi:hypothetical protein